MDLSISPPRIGPHISIEAPRKTRRRQALASIPLAANTTTPTICSQNSHMLFLYRVQIQSVRYTTRPTTWSNCGVFQANPLTVHLNPASSGLFSVPVRDQYACQLLLGMSAAGNGMKALLAVLEHVGKFRYGSKEPAREFYRLSISEKVLHLFFATIPTCPQDGGLVMFPKSKSSVPADGDEMWLERFNYYAHAKPKRQRSGEGEGSNAETSGSGNGGDSLAKWLQPGIGRRMNELRQKLLAKSGGAIVG